MLDRDYSEIGKRKEEEEIRKGREVVIIVNWQSKRYGGSWNPIECVNAPPKLSGPNCVFLIGRPWVSRNVGTRGVYVRQGEAEKFLGMDVRIDI
jgi:hypothetical protein